MSSLPIAFATGSLDHGRKALASVAATFRGRRETGKPAHEVYLDTFDWLIHEAGGTLSASDEPSGPFLCRRAADGQVLHRLRVTTLPGFACELAESPLRTELDKVAGPRRLSPVAGVDVKRTLLCITDGRDKTVARLGLEHGTMTDPEDGGKRHRLPTTLQLIPVKGYESFTNRLSRFLADELGLPAVEPCRMTRALTAAGRSPGGRSSKLRLNLDPGEPAALALRRVLRALLETMRLNEDGVRADLDTEFLHDFRVAVRRTRSALDLVGDVLPVQETERFGAEFAWLGKTTNLLRDLDVHLLSMPELRAMLDEGDRAGLDALEDLLERRRKAELKRLVTELDSERYATLVREWARFLSRPTSAPTPDGPGSAGRPISEVAAKRILRAHRKVMKRGNAIGPETPARELHRVRISCKKLRYLFEFFQSALADDRVKAFIKGLKGLQDNLGAFNDFEVQRDALASLGQDLIAEGRSGPTTEAAVHALTSILDSRRTRERKRFRRCFAQFEKQKVRERLGRALDRRKATGT